MGLMSADGSISAEKAIARVMELFPGTDKLALEVLANTLTKVPDPNRMSEKPGEMMDKTGGPAFPVICPDVSRTQVVLSGMTLRDYFAAKAMLCFAQQDLEILSAAAKSVGLKTSPFVAQSAYALADAMLTEREK